MVWVLASRHGSQKPGEDYMVSPLCGSLIALRSALIDRGEGVLVLMSDQRLMRYSSGDDARPRRYSTTKRMNDVEPSCLLLRLLCLSHPSDSAVRFSAQVTGRSITKPNLRVVPTVLVTARCGHLHLRQAAVADVTLATWTGVRMVFSIDCSTSFPVSGGIIIQQGSPISLWVRSRSSREETAPDPLG